MKNKKLTWVGLLLLLAAGITGVYLWYTQPIGFRYDEQTLLSKEFYGEADPVVSTLSRAATEGWDADDLAATLPETLSLLLYNEDITGDGGTEHVLYNHQEISLAENLREHGYERVIHGLIIYQQREHELIPILKIDTTSILDEAGDRLIDQVPSDYGYAVRITSFEDERLYESPTRVFSLVMVDESGNAASDEIAIYWSPQEQKYQLGSPAN